MATEGVSDVANALIAAVKANAEAAEHAAAKGAAGTAATHSTAALQLAEAYAWIAEPAQSHGRGSTASA
jgi:hypothetical protein